MNHCIRCKQDLSDISFRVRSDRPGKLRTVCKKCSNRNQRVNYLKYKKDSYFKFKCTRTKARAKYIHVPFNLTPEYLESIWSDKCPVINIPINKLTSRTDENAAELDRFIPSKGYTKGNVTFISRKINRIKNNVTSKELRRLLEWMENVEYNRNTST